MADCWVQWYSVSSFESNVAGIQCAVTCLWFYKSHFRVSFICWSQFNRFFLLTLLRPPGVKNLVWVVKPWTHRMFMTSCVPAQATLKWRVSYWDYFLGESLLRIFFVIRFWVYPIFWLDLVWHLSFCELDNFDSFKIHIDSLFRLKLGMGLSLYGMSLLF